MAAEYWMTVNEYRAKLNRSDGLVTLAAPSAADTSLSGALVCGTR